MVTRATIDRLLRRTSEVAEQLGLGEEKPRTVYVVWLSFHGETDEEFLARYPDARGPDGRPRMANRVLRFDDPQFMTRTGADGSADVPRRH